MDFRSVRKAVAPEIEVDAVEIDPEVVRVAHEFFGLPQGDPRLRIHIADAKRVSIAFE